MSRRFAPSVVTANDLRAGCVVYLTAEDRWTRDLREAELIEDEAHAAIRLLDAQGQPGRVVGAALTEARRGRDGPEPATLREAIRAAGPSPAVLPA